PPLQWRRLDDRDPAHPSVGHAAGPGRQESVVAITILLSNRSGPRRALAGSIHVAGGAVRGGGIGPGTAAGTGGLLRCARPGAVVLIVVQPGAIDAGTGIYLRSGPLRVAATGKSGQAHR